VPDRRRRREEAQIHTSHLPVVSRAAQRDASHREETSGKVCKLCVEGLRTARRSPYVPEPGARRGISGYEDGAGWQATATRIPITLSTNPSQATVPAL
jgi:hypothetical protein